MAPYTEVMKKAFMESIVQWQLPSSASGRIYPFRRPPTLSSDSKHRPDVLSNVRRVPHNFEVRRAGSTADAALLFSKRVLLHLLP